MELPFICVSQMPTPPKKKLVSTYRGVLQTKYSRLHSRLPNIFLLNNLQDFLKSLSRIFRNQNCLLKTSGVMFGKTPDPSITRGISICIFLLRLHESFLTKNQGTLEVLMGRKSLVFSTQVNPTLLIKANYAIKPFPDYEYFQMNVPHF